MKKGEGKIALLFFSFKNMLGNNNDNKVTPGFTAVEYEKRRSNLMSTLPEDSVVVCLGYGTRYMTNNIFYPFHQNTDFWYLCGFNEPDSALILGK